MSDHTHEVPRRRFLQLLIVAFNAAIALLLAVPGLGYLLTPVFRRGAEQWVSLGSQSDFAVDGAVKANFTYISESGYVRNEKQGFVWMTRKDQEYVALSPVCSHTGCNVAWRPGEGRFVCPCHEGRYDIEGNVVSGPPPRPLAQLPVRIENGEIQIQVNRSA